MKRVSIIGCCGAGKSTLARQLHEITNLPLIHLDREYWQYGWKATEKEEFRNRVRKLYSGSAWIIDGHYFSTMDERLSRSDTVYHLDYETFICLQRILRRIILGLGRDRLDCADGCPERLDFEFIKYVMTFRKKFRNKTLSLLNTYSHLEIRSFDHPKELTNHLKILKQS